MAISASRLGSSPIALDWSGLGSPHPDPQTESAWMRLKARFDSREIGFYNTPSDNELSQAVESAELARKLLSSQNFTDCLFLGIGGSALGPLTVLDALQDCRANGLKFHFVQNTDAWEWKATLKDLNPERTLIVVVTKSGTTFETLAQFLCALKWMPEKLWSSHVVAITDPARGDLRTWANQRKLQTLSIHPSIGGRFSVFCPVGLFAIELAGLNSQQFLLGATQVRDYCEKTALPKNALFLIGSELLSLWPKRSVHVCMPYSSRLKQVGAWFVQLWGESLGKEGKGFTPLAALGATDQHSILQLLRDGPQDKVIQFLTIDEAPDSVAIPRPLLESESAKLPAFRILEGSSLHQLMQIEYRATSLVMTKANRPHWTWRLDRLDERSMGSLLFAYCVLTAFTGTLWGVNPFDQPGVEEGKVYIKEALSVPRLETAEDDTHSAVSRLRRGNPDDDRQ
jgi:glucose-6-phosphate isomerase